MSRSLFFSLSVPISVSLSVSLSVSKSICLPVTSIPRPVLQHLFRFQ